MNTLTREETQTNGAQTGEGFVAPPVTITESESGYGLSLEMPGVTKENLEVSVENHELTVIGRRSSPSIEGHLVHRESRRGNYRRLFALDPSIDPAKISATIEQGIVALSLPKAEQVKARKIAVA